MKKLKLNRETVRWLTDLRQIKGGVVKTEGTCLTRNPDCSFADCPTVTLCG